jgi:hypothetical protein
MYWSNSVAFNQNQNCRAWAAKDGIVDRLSQ